MEKAHEARVAGLEKQLNEAQAEVQTYKEMVRSLMRLTPLQVVHIGQFGARPEALHAILSQP